MLKLQSLLDQKKKPQFTSLEEEIRYKKSNNKSWMIIRGS